MRKSHISLSIDNIKHVEVGDILGRSSVTPRNELLRKNISDKNILITGAGGSIGVELSRQIMKLSPNKVVLVDNAEFNLYSIHLELKDKESNVEVIPALCTITNYNQLKKIISEHKIHTIYHAAAYKHVPMVEMNIVSGVYNNVVGTYNVAKLADELDVESMVLISTDKAVKPTSIMGCSKRISEIILLHFAKKIIDIAVDAGCNAVKLQKKNVEKIYTKKFLDSLLDSPWGTTQREMRLHREFSDNEFKKI